MPESLQAPLDGLKRFIATGGRIPRVASVAPATTDGATLESQEVGGLTDAGPLTLKAVKSLGDSNGRYGVLYHLAALAAVWLRTR